MRVVYLIAASALEWMIEKMSHRRGLGRGVVALAPHSPHSEEFAPERHHRCLAVEVDSHGEYGPRLQVGHLGVLGTPF